MTMSSVTVRVDSDTKQKASDIAEDFGFDLSSDRQGKAYSTESFVSK